MGAWSEDILGGDTPLDILSVFSEAIGEESLYPVPAGRAAKRVRVKLEDKADELLKLSNTVNTRSYDYHGERHAILGAMFIATGAAMPDKLRELAVAAAKKLANDAKKHGWNDPELRTNYMNGLAAKLEAHKAGEVVDLRHKGLFQKMAEAFGK